MKVARLCLRVSTDEQDLTRQVDIEHSTRAAGYYVAGIYREKASGARADRPELLRMIADLQPGEVVVAEKIDGSMRHVMLCRRFMLWLSRNQYRSVDYLLRRFRAGTMLRSEAGEILPKPSIIEVEKRLGRFGFVTPTG